MGFFDRLLGRDDTANPPGRPEYQPYRQVPEPRPSHPDPIPQPGQHGHAGAQGARSADDVAIERYRYLLQTAPPDRIEQAHHEAFQQLTPEQRQRVFTELSQSGGEQPRGDDPQSLAQAATRAEIRQPGSMERVLGGIPSGGQGAQGGGRSGPGFGTMLGASLLGTVGGYVIGSAVMSAFLPPLLSDGGADAAGADAGDAGGQEAGGDASADGFGGGTGEFGHAEPGDGGGGLFGGFFGDGGGDIGGGDLGF